MLKGLYVKLFMIILERVRKHALRKIHMLLKIKKMNIYEKSVCILISTYKNKINDINLFLTNNNNYSK